MNARKMQFIARLPKNISAAATNRRNFTSDRGLWMNTVLKRTPNTNHCVVQTSGDRREFQIWVRDKKDGYKPQKVVSNKQHMIDGFKMLRSEFKLWKEEVKERLLGDPILVFRPDETDAAWSFGDNDEDFKKFIVTSDSDHNEGYSKCSFVKSPAGYGLFSGTLDSTVPITGVVQRTGYCNITSLRATKSFQRQTYYDWSAYNTLVLRIRGDGRPYMINIWSEGHFDVMWNDMYHHVLYTRGGPHWQVSKIPFSKFFLASKGSVQDKQTELLGSRVSRFGITAAGLIDTDGPFSLEIDYIGLENDPHHNEEFAYEMYQVPKFLVGNG